MNNKVAIIGSGIAGIATSIRLKAKGFDVTVYEKNNRIGGLLRYGIPDFKMEKHHIDRRINQMTIEGVDFKTETYVGNDNSSGLKVISPNDLRNNFDAVLLAGGAEVPRDLPVSGRNLDGVHFAMNFLPQQNKVCAGDKIDGQINAKGKHVIVIGGGDTGSDCVGTANRHGAKSVTQFELMPQPPTSENKNLVWPYWPQKLRTSSSHLEGCDREFAIATKKFLGKDGILTGLETCNIRMDAGKFIEIEGTEKVYKADLVLLAMGFVSPSQSIFESFKISKDSKGNVDANNNGKSDYKTSLDKIFVAGDMRRGQSLVVWAIREGRDAAESIDSYLKTGF